MEFICIQFSCILIQINRLLESTLLSLKLLLWNKWRLSYPKFYSIKLMARIENLTSSFLGTLVGGNFVPLLAHFLLFTIWCSIFCVKTRRKRSLWGAAPIITGSRKGGWNSNLIFNFLSEMAVLTVCFQVGKLKSLPLYQTMIPKSFLVF